MGERIWWLVTVILIFTTVFGLWWYVGFSPALNRVPGFDFSKDGTTDPSLTGVFGDSFGWINSLFSALAFAGVIVTVLLQTRELRLQHTEMHQTRKELILQNRVLCATSQMGATGSLASAYATLVSGQTIEERERVNTLGIHVDGIESMFRAGSQLQDNYRTLTELALEQAEGLPDSEQKRVFLTFAKAFLQRLQNANAIDEHTLRGMYSISRGFPSLKLQELEKQLKQQERDLQRLIEEASEQFGSV